MSDLAARIAQASAEEMDAVLNAVIQRYGDLYPDWEVTFISLERHSDRGMQLERMIAALEKIKNS